MPPRKKRVTMERTAVKERILCHKCGNFVQRSKLQRHVRSHDPKLKSRSEGKNASVKLQDRA